MMRVRLTNEKFDSNPYWTEKVKSRFETPSIRWLELFDQNGLVKVIRPKMS